MARFPTYWSRRHYEKSPADYATKDASLSEVEQQGFETLLTFVGKVGVIDLSRIVNKFGDALVAEFADMSNLGYMKHLKSGKGKPASSEQNAPDKRQKRKADSQGGRTASEGPSEAVVAQAAPRPPSPPVHVTPEVVTLPRGDLWKRGLSSELRAVIAPPPEMASSASLPGPLLSTIWRIQEEALKAASLLSSYEEIRQKYHKASSLNAHLSTKVSDQSTKIAELTTERSVLKTELGRVTGDLMKLREDLTKLVQDSKMAKVALRKGEERSKQLEAEVSRLRADYEDAQEQIGKVAEEVFENVLAQAKALNPELNTTGIDLTSHVKDGQIVPYADVDDVSEAEMAPVVVDRVEGGSVTTPLGEIATPSVGEGVSVPGEVPADVVEVVVPESA